MKTRCQLSAFIGLLLVVLAGAGCGREARPPARPDAGSPRLLAATPLAGQPCVLAELGLELLPVAAGTFRMGSPLGEPGRTMAEGPPTWVVISQPFWLGRTPVTHGQWRAVMGSDLVDQARKVFPRDRNPARLLTATADDAAMYFVTWHEAVEFCERLNARARAEGTLPRGYAFGLPTEAQWEYACRAGTMDATPAGPMEAISPNHAPVLDPIAWYAGNSSVGYQGSGWDTSGWPGKQYPGGLAGVRRVGLKAPNAWGFHDMLGNVNEWCRDRAADALPGGRVTDPTGPTAGHERIVRGGSWHSPAAYCRSAYRAWSIPDGRMPFIGFRLALVPVAVK